MENITLKQIGVWVAGLAVTVVTIVAIVYFAGLAWRASQTPR